MSRKVVLITGASSGIGYELSKVFGSNEYDLVIVGRNENMLIELKNDLISKFNIDIEVIVKDLSKANASKEIYDYLKHKGINVDILINNAGMGICELFHETELDLCEEMINLNILQLTLLTRLICEDMVIKGEGSIINICSTGAYQPGPYVAIYYATKAYVRAFSQAIESELRGRGVGVITVYPGAVRSNFAKRAGKKDLKSSMEPEDVARKIFNDFKKGRKRIIPGVNNRVAIIISKLMPGYMCAELVKKIKEKQKV